MYVDTVARTMLARAETLSAGWGFRRLFLSTSTVNRAAVELYRSAGSSRSDTSHAGVRVFTSEEAFGAGCASARLTRDVGAQRPSHCAVAAAAPACLACRREARRRPRRGAHAPTVCGVVGRTERRALRRRHHRARP
jgi:hypothetical protein